MKLLPLWGEPVTAERPRKCVRLMAHGRGEGTGGADERRRGVQGGYSGAYDEPHGFQVLPGANLSISRFTPGRGFPNIQS
jgi:hypothetical protein